MHRWLKAQQWKYLKVELLFFVVFCYLFPILTDIEFNYRETHHTALFLNDISYRLVYGTTDLIAFLLFYQLTKKFLLGKRIFSYIISIVLFLIFLQYFSRAVYFVVGYSGVFPEKLRIDALRWYNDKGRLNFSVVYVFTKFICIAALAYFVRSAKQEEQMQQLKEEQLRSELNYLKAQLHPHFFFNTLNNIYALALQQSPNTGPLVAKLAEMMRYILYEADQKKVSLEREIQFISNYVAVEKIRHPEQTAITFDVQGNARDVMLEPLLLLPFIENAFKHGLQEDTGLGFVNIVICMMEKELILEISNSKPVTVADHATKGIGLQNVLKRLAILYGDQYQLDLKQDAGSYRIYLNLPIA